MRSVARALRRLADWLSPEVPAEGVRVYSEVPESLLTPVLEAISKSAFERAWPCASCGKLLAVSPAFIRDEGPKWVKCGPCSAVYHAR